jgi:hypothetical protein
MKRVIIMGMVIIGGAISAFPSVSKDKEAEFFSGVLLLQSATALSAGQKSEKYRELQIMTGITSARAKSLLSAFRDDPEEWQRLCTMIIQLLSKSEFSSPASTRGPEPENIR